jgi:hypothetical protein
MTNKKTLTEKELKTYNSLVRLGDSPELALKTVLNERKTAHLKSSVEFERFAYEN